MDTLLLDGQKKELVNNFMNDFNLVAYFFRT